MRTTPSSARRRSQRFSPFPPRLTSQTPGQCLRSPEVQRRVAFSPHPQPRTPLSIRMSCSPSVPPRRQTSPAKTGRPRSSIWEHFYIEYEGSKKHGRCRYCRSLVKNGKPSDNLPRHLLQKCPNLPTTVKMELLAKPATVHQPNETENTPAPLPQESPVTQEQFNIALATMFYACALPMLLVEAESFKAFINLIAPAMKIPSRHMLSNGLLHQVRDQMRAKVIDLINEHAYVSLVTDGWSDTNGTSIINFMVVAPGMPSLFWTSWSTRSEQHTAKYLEDQISKVIDDIHSTTTARVTGVVTDNASNMRGARTGLEARLPTLICGGCAAHVLNLLIQDICRSTAIQAVQSRAVSIARFVRDHLALLDEFRALQGLLRAKGHRARCLVLPLPTRWYSVHACLKSVLSSQDVLERLMLSPDYESFRERYRGTGPSRKKLEYVASVIRDHCFWANLRIVVRLLDPIIETLRKLEADSTPVSAVYLCFRWLRYHSAYGVTSPDNERCEAIRGPSTTLDQAGMELLGDATNIVRPPRADSNVPLVNPAAVAVDSQIALISLADIQIPIRQHIKKRWEYVHTNAMGIAFLLDPSMDLDDFIADDEEKAEAQACTLAQRCAFFNENVGVPRLTAELVAFKSMKRSGGRAMRQRYSESSPQEYWRSMSSKKYPLLKKIADVVFSVPTSSAASERAWSIFDHIHTKKRNKLSVAKVEMLAYVYINYGTIEKSDVDFAQHQSCPDAIDDDTY